ncbi:hypothetical protein AGMMS49525_14680 [Bacteroidia bacterium]|nr:hypothetical protein AGMMS49525_14680 [Bacteroidia bacterium]
MLSSLAAQNIHQDVKTQIGTYLTQSVRQHTAVANITIDSVAINKKILQLFANENLSYMRFDRAMTDNLYNHIRTFLPDDLKKHKLELYSDGYKIEDYIPLLRKERFTNKVDVPLKRNLSTPYTIKQGLQNRHLALWQSHGWYYEQKLDRWEWQRARIFQTVEDLYTQSYVLPYLVPMLENAGANVILPRERDTQRHEIIVDNDRNHDGWSEGDGTGFAHVKQVYYDNENPFTQGNYLQAKTVKKGAITPYTWQPEIPEKGKYAVYVSYKSLPNSTKDACYTVYHTGGQTRFSINQTMGGGTWIYLGHFDFDKGNNAHGKIVLSNESKDANKIVTADAVKIGGGMGNIARGEDGTMETSGRPRYVEGARYWLQWAGMPDSVYRWSKGERDYTDDYQSRGLWVNYMKGLNVPLDAAFAFHSDAGTTYNDSIIGTLGICMTHYKNELFDNGKPRILSRDLTQTIADEIVEDIRLQYEPNWTRRQIWNKSYSEARLPEVPTMLLELLSHQNFADMRYGLDPNFQFTVSRAIYKGFLKFIAHQYGYDYVVQPLPVRSFSTKFTGDTQVQLAWQATGDVLESTAVPTGYILYTSVNDGDFDNGILVQNTQINLTIQKDQLYRFKIAATNDGGVSFPSEILSVYRKNDEKGTVLVVNGFNRLSAPDSFVSKDSLGGFLDNFDHGVPDKVQYNYIGSQHEFRRSVPWMDDDAAGFGASNGNYETTLIAGNTFDYPAIHGKAIAQAGYSFVSSSAEAVMLGSTNMNDYKVTDLILGKQKQTQIGRDGAMPPRFKTFPDELQNKIQAYCQQGGNIFVSGAFVATDLWDNEWVQASDKNFAQDVLKYYWRTGHAAVTGKVKNAPSPYAQFANGNYQFDQQLNSVMYAVESPDALEPATEDAYTVFRYSENNLSAGVAYSGSYKTCVLGFPFETVQEDSSRNELMHNVLEFLTSQDNSITLTPEEKAYRIAVDFHKSKADVLKYISQYYSDVTDAQLLQWENDKKLEAMTINGEKKYFDRAAANLFLLDATAAARRNAVNKPRKDDSGTDKTLRTHLPAIVAEAQKSRTPQASPVTMTVNYEVKLKANTVPDGEVVRCWLPYPREDHRRQSAVKLLSVNNDNYIISPGKYAHRTLYMEKTAKKDEPLTFSYSFSYRSTPEWFNLAAKKIRPYDTGSKLYKTYTAERAPHIVFTDSIKTLSTRVVGNETNPYQKVKKLFSYIRNTYPWAGAREYATLDNIPQYVMENGHGDCGQVTLLFMTLARYNGIPTRWQSGFMMHPDNLNLHDWGEYYIEGSGWIPIDQSFGIKDYGAGDEVKYFYSGGIDAYRLIVNNDFSRPLYPNKQFARSDNVDFQRGELEWRGGNIYYPHWSWDIDVDY